jgi:integrase
MSKLTAAKIAKLDLGRPAQYGDGHGLWLQVSVFQTRAWILRYMTAGRARVMGLGGYPEVSLKEAREHAAEARKQLRFGIDPIDARRERKFAKKIEAAKRISFLQCAKDYIAEHQAGWKNEKHLAQWRATFEGENAATTKINALPVAEIDTALVLSVLRPIWKTTPETASRIRGRIERVLAWATVSEYRRGENPARWRGHLGEMLPKVTKLSTVKHHAALPYADVPAFMVRLRDNDCSSARALEFTILNASRTGEALGATWDEIDFDHKVWTVPASRMKAGKEHRVPLTERALEILKSLPRERDNPYVFVGTIKGKSLSDRSMIELLKGMSGNGCTVHGFRSSFRDWAAEQTNYPRELAECALAHTLPDKVERAYQRGDLLEKRRRLMAEWARFCAKPIAKSGDVVPLHEARA